MNAVNTFEYEILKLIFNNTDIVGIGDLGGIRGSVTAGNLYVRLCTNAVQVSDSQVGTECSYTGYVAGGVAVGRTITDWSVMGSTAININDIVFGECTAGSDTVSYVEIWRNNTGNTDADRVAWKDLPDDLLVSVGIIPVFYAGDIIITFDQD